MLLGTPNVHQMGATTCKYDVHYQEFLLSHFHFVCLQHYTTPCQQRPHLFHLCGAQFGSRIPSLRTNIYGRVTHDNVRQLKSTNDAVLIVVPFHGKVHEFLTLLNGCQVLCTTFYETYVDRVLCICDNIQYSNSLYFVGIDHNLVDKLWQYGSATFPRLRTF